MAMRAIIFLICILPATVWGQTFYISADYAYSRQSMDLSGERWSYGGGAGGIVDSDSGKVIMSPGKEYSHIAPGGNKTSNGGRGAFALGIDLKSKYNLPLRFELEGAFQDISNVGYKGVYGEYGSGNNTDIPRTENFGAKQFVRAKYFSFMLSGYLDFHNRTPFTPYIGAGAGAAHYSAKLTSEISIEYKEETTRPGINIGSAGRPEKFTQNEEGWLLSVSLSAGVAYKLTDSVVVDLAYKYSYMDDIDFGPSASGPYSAQSPLLLETSGQTLSSDNHQIILGMRFLL